MSLSGDDSSDTSNSKSRLALYTGEKRNTKDIWAEVGEIKKKKLNIEINVIEEEWKLKKIKYGLEINQLKKINKSHIPK